VERAPESIELGGLRPFDPILLDEQRSRLIWQALPPQRILDPRQ
jgi:hypothetical protein